MADKDAPDDEAQSDVSDLELPIRAAGSTSGGGWRGLKFVEKITTVANILLLVITLAAVIASGLTADASVKQSKRASNQANALARAAIKESAVSDFESNRQQCLDAIIQIDDDSIDVASVFASALRKAHPHGITLTPTENIAILRTTPKELRFYAHCNRFFDKNDPFLNSLNRNGVGAAVDYKTNKLRDDFGDRLLWTLQWVAAAEHHVLSVSRGKHVTGPKPPDFPVDDD